MSTINVPYVVHADIVSYADKSVNLKRDDAQEYRQQVRNLREKIEAFIELKPDLGLEKLLLFGSLAKGTGLKTLNDVDLAVYVRSDNSNVPGAQADLILWLADRVREAYPQMAYSQIVPSEYSVTVSFSQSGLNVDIVPIKYDGDPDGRGYLFTRSTIKPVLTSIPLQLEFIRKRKDKQPTHFAQVARLFKWWLKEQSRKDSSLKFKSFLAEMIVAKLADESLQLDDYPQAMEAIFKYIVKSQLKERIAFTDNYKTSQLPPRTGAAIEIFDPVNPDNNMAEEYSDYERNLIVDAAEESLDALAESRFATTKQRAVGDWKLLFGPTFQG